MTNDEKFAVLSRLVDIPPADWVDVTVQCEPQLMGAAAGFLLYEPGACLEWTIITRRRDRSKRPARSGPSLLGRSGAALGGWYRP